MHAIIRTNALALALCFAAGLCWRGQAQTYDTNGVVVQTLAGSGVSGYADGIGQQAVFYNPLQIVADSQSNLFVWDNNNGRIRRIAPDATVTSLTTNVQLGFDCSMTVDRNDNIWAISTTGPGESYYLYKITSNAIVTRTNFSLNSVSQATRGGICADSVGNIYVSDQHSCSIYRYDTNGILTVFAGSGSPGYADLNGTFAAFNSPQALASDAADNIYVWDRGNYLIRRIDQSRNVATYAGQYGGGAGAFPDADGVGTNAVFSGPQSFYAFDLIQQMCCDRSGNLILACQTSVRQISATTNVTTLAGSFTQSGYTNGPGNLARFTGANGICISGDTIYVADISNQRIRSITNNPIPIPVLPANLKLSTYPGLQITGTVGRTYRIQVSPDMNTWNTVATVLLPSSPYLWIDQNPVSGKKFYRALLLP